MAAEGLRPPRQARSRRTLRNLEQAARELVSRDGADSVTVADVVARARSSVGSFYARFSGKEEFFAHLCELGWQDVLERWQEAAVARAGSPDAVVKALAAFLVDMEQRDGTLRRSLASVSPPVEGGAEFRREVSRSLVEPLGLGRTGEARIGLALEVGLSVLDVLRRQARGVTGEGDEAWPPGALLADLTAILSCLLLRPPAPAGVAAPASEGGPPNELLEGSGQIGEESPESDSFPVDPFDVWG